ncbi:hypothetical protein tb265_46600 [Gemmatimonadetes bacterium T265]|nr:hypothetical protein tb265_46600 [Gemmatimonadetes bacterium T265]
MRTCARALDPAVRPVAPNFMAHFTTPRLRVLYGAAVAIGPGKADLLDAIARTGSISAGGRALGMSYRRAWLLVETMNRCFRAPVVTAAKGGSHGGGARLTPFGADVLAWYRVLEAEAAAALRDLLAEVPPAPPGERLPGRPDRRRPLAGPDADVPRA